jgi:hypothetical protein
MGMLAVVALVGLVSLVAGVVLGWYLRRANVWCPHCGDQLICEGCRAGASWPRRRITAPTGRQHFVR